MSKSWRRASLRVVKWTFCLGVVAVAWMHSLYSIRYSSFEPGRTELTVLGGRVTLSGSSDPDTSHDQVWPAPRIYVVRDLDDHYFDVSIGFDRPGARARLRLVELRCGGRQRVLDMAYYSLEGRRPFDITPATEWQALAWSGVLGHSIGFRSTAVRIERGVQAVDLVVSFDLSVRGMEQTATTTLRLTRKESSRTVFGLGD